MHMQVLQSACFHFLSWPDAAHVVLRCHKQTTVLIRPLLAGAKYDNCHKLATQTISYSHTSDIRDCDENDEH